jgi:hypothetical protein
MEDLVQNGGDVGLPETAKSVLKTDMSDPLAQFKKISGEERSKVAKAESDLAEAQIAKQQQAAQLKSDFAKQQAGQMSGLLSQYEKQAMAPAPKREIDAQTKEGMMGLAALLPVAGAFFGGKGLTSATGAMQAMTGLLKGYQEGNKERIAFEQKKYDDAMKEFDRHQNQIKEAFNIAIKKAQVNQTAAQTELEVKLAALDAPLLREMVKKNGIVAGAEENIKMAQNSYTHKQQYEEKLQLAKDIAEARTGTKTSQQAIQSGQRMINATAGAASGFEAISGIKGGTTTGILPFLSTKEGITDFLKNSAGRKFTSDDAKILDVYYTGIGRNLAAIEASGAATGLVGLTKSFENLKPMVGDSNYVVAAKLADAKRVVEETMKAAISSGTLTPDQKKTADDLVKRIEKAIPFTIEDVNKSVTKGKPTIGEVTTKTVQGKPTAEQFLERARAANPGATDEQLLEFYNKKYGGQ